MSLYRFEIVIFSFNYDVETGRIFSFFFFALKISSTLLPVTCNTFCFHDIWINSWLSVVQNVNEQFKKRYFNSFVLHLGFSFKKKEKRKFNWHFSTQYFHLCCPKKFAHLIRLDQCCSIVSFLVLFVLGSSRFGIICWNPISAFDCSSWTTISGRFVHLLQLRVLY